MDTSGRQLPSCLCLHHLIDYCVHQQVGIIPQGRFYAPTEYCLWCILKIKIDSDNEGVPISLYGLCEEHIEEYIMITNMSYPCVRESADTYLCIFCNKK